MTENRLTASTDVLNFLASRLGEVLDGLTVLELWPGEGVVSERLLKEGADQAILVEPEMDEYESEDDQKIWIPTDPMNILGGDRKQDVGLVYTAAPENAEVSNSDVLSALGSTKFLVKNCLVVLAERPYDRTQLENFKEFEQVESRRFDDLQITLAQMIDPVNV